MIRLLIKGDYATALSAMLDRSIPEIDNAVPHNDCMIMKTRDDKWREVMDWFGEEGHAPFPPGSLLHFAMDQKE